MQVGLLFFDFFTMTRPTLEDYAAALPTSVPLDERQVFNAIHDPNVVNIRDIQKAQEDNEARQYKEAQETWQELLESTIPAQVVQPQPLEEPAILNSQHPIFKSSTQEPALRAIGHMLHDIKHYDTLPFDSHSKKLKHCFVDNYRVYATFMAVLLVVVFCVLVGLCFMPSHSVDVVANLRHQDNSSSKHSYSTSQRHNTKVSKNNKQNPKKRSSWFSANTF